MSADEHKPAADTAEAESFRDKIRSIQFLGRGKTSRKTQIISDGKHEIERAGGEFT